MDNNRKQEREAIIPENIPSTRIDRYLAERFTYYSRSEWQRIITNGLVSLNGTEIRNPHRKVNPGDRISYLSPEIDEPYVDKKYNILYQDRWLIGIDKPGNLPVHPAGRFRKNTLLTILEDDYKNKLYPIHRLDRETSGVILFAKNRDTASSIQKNFSTVKKEYIALVHGHAGWKEREVAVPIGNDAASQVRKKRAAFEGAPESAVTRFKKILTFGNYTLLKAMPATGRLHQIRTHCLYMQMPIVGDKLYGRDESAYLEFIEGRMTEEMLKKMEMPRSALHSRSLRFFHPGISRDIRVTAPLPDDIKDFISRKKNEAGSASI